MMGCIVVLQTSTAALCMALAEGLIGQVESFARYGPWAVVAALLALNIWAVKRLINNQIDHGKESTQVEQHLDATMRQLITSLSERPCLLNDQEILNLKRETKP